MKVLDPDNTTHNITFTPRFDPTGAFVLTLEKEGYDDAETVSNSYTQSNGYVTVTFDYEVVNNERYSIKITEDGDVIYRGKITVTNQETQEYSLTTNLVTY